MNRLARIRIVSRMCALGAAVALAGCWDEAEVRGRWTGADERPNIGVRVVDSGEVHEIRYVDDEGRFSFKIACPGHYSFVVHTNPPIVAFLWTERTFTGCKANGAEKLKSLPESAG